MRHPQIVVCAFDDWTANQLRPLAAENRWLLKSVRQPPAALELIRESRPTVLFVQADPTEERIESLRLVADAYRLRPDAAVVLMSDRKLPPQDQAPWAATGYDLGARFVLFPPLTRSVLEDLVGGLMTATIRRVLGESKVEPVRIPTESAEVIDLAHGGYEDE